MAASADSMTEPERAARAASCRNAASQSSKPSESLPHCAACAAPRAAAAASARKAVRRAVRAPRAKRIVLSRSGLAVFWRSYPPIVAVLAKDFGARGDAERDDRRKKKKLAEGNKTCTKNHTRPLSWLHPRTRRR